MIERKYQRRTRRITAGVLSAGLVITGLVGISSPKAAADPPVAAQAHSAPVGTDAGEKVLRQDKVKLSKAEQERFADKAPETRTSLRSAAEDDATGTPIGGEKNWLLYDSVNGYGAAPYVLRGVGTDIEVWVQKDLDYPAGDCRNDGVRNVITDEQVTSLVNEFDNNILAKESEVFSVAPERDGTKSVDVGFGAPLWEILGDGDKDYYKGDGNKTVMMVSNARDENYYDPTSPEGATYTAGFFSPLFNEGFDRNVMTIDSYDWVHRTGANPPDETPGGLCSTKQAAQAHMYEGTIAHEYQHLLQYYTDPGESTWLNEGLSDYAQTLVGYVDTTLPYGDKDSDSHITCFQGFYGSGNFPYCGAENSLTRWEDQGAPSTLSDYGAAYTFVTYVADKLGEDAITFLHKDGKAQGLASLQNYLDDHAPGLTATDMVHDWAAMMAVDRLADNKGKGLTKDEKQRFTSKQLNSAIDWSWSGSYDTVGAPANGSDYVLGMDGRPVNARTLQKLKFNGDKGFAPDPLAWTINESALYGGVGDDLDQAAVYPVDVPESDATLTFSNKYDIEQGWDFGIVQVSTDGGKTYKTLANDHTSSEHADGADGKIVGQLPGLSGVTDGWQEESFDLSEYAGKNVLVSFRWMTDAATNGNSDATPGWWIKDVKVGETTVTDGTTLEGAKSATEISPIPIEGWKVQVVGWTLGSKVKIDYAELKVNKNNVVNLDRQALKKLVKKADRVGVIVTADDPEELATKNAGYELRINGTLQAGGGTPSSEVAAKTLPLSKELPVKIN